MSVVARAWSDRGVFDWWRVAPPKARRAFIAAALGWMLDAMDMMFYALVLAALMGDLALDKTTAGLLGSVTLVASAVGGLLFGMIADRYGRTRALMGSILIYSVFTAACGLSQNVVQLAIFRLLLGLGMGGEWACGAALVSETWPPEHRGTALGFMQSSWAVGFAIAAVVTALILPLWGWRAVFFVGILPALLTLWIRRRVEEPEIWQRLHRSPSRAEGGLLSIFRGRLLPLTFAITSMSAFTMFASWGFNLWLPAYLALPVESGGIGLSTYAMSAFVVVMEVGRWFGYVTFGYVSDIFGRKRTYIFYLIAAVASTFAYAVERRPFVLLLLGPLASLFGMGIFAGFGAITAEIYPTGIRATAQGFTYNTGRLASAIAPFVVGTLADSHGFGAALLTVPLAYLLAVLTWIWIPETRGRELE